MSMDNQTESILLSTLSSLTPTQLSSLTTTLSSTFDHHRHRLVSLLSSPTLFTHTLNNLYSLSLPQKSLLISRHFLSFLHLLTPFVSPTFPSHAPRFRLRDIDSVLLLLYFCEIRQTHPKSLETSPIHWHQTLADCCSDTMLNISSFAISNSDLLGMFIDIMVKCKRFVSTKGCGREMEKRDIATSVAVVVGLPSVEVTEGGKCTICREELCQGRDVCELPCKHLFHWICVLPWLRTTNTCPCCRFRLPTDDVFGEIHRLWDVIERLAVT